MSKELSGGQNFLLGTIAALIEGVILQPTLYWKNAKAQQLPFTIDIRTIYRGTAASILNECQMMGLQFGLTGFFIKVLANGDPLKLSKYDMFASAALGGIAASVFSSPAEMIMIQQQKFGASLIETPKSIIRNYGIGKRGMMRGWTAAATRDGIYVTGMLAVTPLLQDYLISNHNTPVSMAGVYASMIGGCIAALPSHPFDVVKTCMQGDLEGSKYTTFSKTLKALWKEGGIARISSGCMWRTINITATVYIANECRIRLGPYMEFVAV